MKTIKRTLYILTAFIAIISNQACGSSEIKDDQLSSFMLGGIYFIHGYGGIDETKKMISDAGYTSDKEIVAGYKEIFEFPFDTSQKIDLRNVLKDWWDITNTESLIKESEILKTSDSKYKAWDYARLVNNAAIGYGAGYLSKEEATKIITEILPLAREKYKTWEEYFTDYNLGRQEWDPTNENTAEFESLSINITKGDDSIYKILPLQ